MAKIKIMDTRRFPSAEMARRGQFDNIITYQNLDTLQTYVLTVSKDNPTDTEIKAAIKEDMKKRSAIVGKEFEI